MKWWQFGFYYLKSFRSRFILYLSLSLIGSMLGLFLPIVQGQFMDAITKLDPNYFNYVLLFFIISVLIWVAQLVSQFIYIRLQANVGLESNLSLLKAIYNRSYLQVAGLDPSYLNQAVNHDCNELVIFSLEIVQNMIVKVVTLVWVGYYLYQNTTFLFFFLIIMAGFYPLIYGLMKKKLYQVNLAEKESSNHFFQSLNNLVASIRSLQRTGLFEGEVKHVKRFFNLFLTSLKQQFVVQQVNDGLAQVVSLGSEILIFVVCGQQVLSGHLTIGVLIVVLSYFSTMADCFLYFFSLGKQSQSLKASYDRLLRYQQYEMSFGTKNIHFQTVNLQCDFAFGYQQKQLFHITQNFCPNQIYWVKGANGVGKTSFFDCLLGVYGSNYDGSITLNGIERNEFSRNSYLSYFSICEQTPFLLNGSIKDNLAPWTEEKDQLCHQFKLDPNQQISREASYLSGGQAQKVALIRTLCSQAPILLLDEPLASLDQDSKEWFKRSLLSYKKDRIILIISHEAIETDHIIQLTNTPTQD